MLVRGVVVDQATDAAIPGAVVFVDAYVTPDRPLQLPLLDLSLPPRQLDSGSNVVRIGSVRDVTGTTTRADGAFALELDRSAHHLVVFAPTHEPQIVPLAADPGPLHVALERGGRLEGAVVSAQGIGLPGVRVYICPLPYDAAARYGRSVVTDPSGRFAVAGLGPGRYEAIAVLDGIEDRSVTATIERDGTEEISLDMGTAIVLRVIVHAELDLVPETVSISWSSPPSAEGRQWSVALEHPVETEPDSRGTVPYALPARVAVVHDQSDLAKLRLAALGYRAVERMVSIGELATGRVEWDVTLERSPDSGRLVVELQDAHGRRVEPVPRLRMWINERPNTRFHVGYRRGQDLEFPLLIPGTYRITIEVVGRGKGTLDVDLGAGESRRVVVTLHAR